MSAPIGRSGSVAFASLPDASPALLPGESLERNRLIRQVVLADIVPRPATGWLLKRGATPNAGDFDPDAACKLEVHLAAYGIDQSTIGTDVYIQARDAFAMFEALINSTRSRRIALLREISSQRRSK